MKHYTNTHNPIDFPKSENEMNEQIKLLAEQAGFFPELNWDYTGWHAAGYNTTFEMFAKLIVKECLNQCYFQGMNDELYAGQLKAAGYIEQHFGVEG